MLEEAIRKIMTFDQEACFESIRKQVLERIRSDRDSNRLMSLEEYTADAIYLTTFYFTNHHIPYMFYTIGFVEKKYPELLQRIKEMVRETFISAEQA